MIGPIDTLLWALIAIAPGITIWVIEAAITSSPTTPRGRSPDQWLWFDERTALGEN